MGKKKPKPYGLVVGVALAIGLGWFSGYWWAHRVPEACACMCLVPPMQIN